MYQQYYQQGCNLGQQAMQAEMSGNPSLASQLYDQSIWQINFSINLALQSGVYVPDCVFFSLAFSHYRAASAKAILGWMPVAWNHLAQSLFALNQAIGRNPNDYRYHAAAGEVLMAQGNLLEAERAFLFALQLNPTDPRANWMLGYLYSVRQQQYLQQQYLQTAYQVAPSLNQVQSSLPTIPPAPANSTDSNWLDNIVKVTTIINNVLPLGSAIFKLWS